MKFVLFAFCFFSTTALADDVMFVAEEQDLKAFDAVLGAQKLQVNEIQKGDVAPKREFINKELEKTVRSGREQMEKTSAQGKSGTEPDSVNKGSSMGLGGGLGNQEAFKDSQEKKGKKKGQSN